MEYCGLLSFLGSGAGTEKQELNLQETNNLSGKPRPGHCPAGKPGPRHCTAGKPGPRHCTAGKPGPRKKRIFYLNFQFYVRKLMNCYLSCE